MRNLIVSEFVSVDGVVENPSWTFQFSGEEQEKFKFDELVAVDELLLGRVTYEGFASAWPKMMEQYEGPGRAELQEYADMMNGYPKYVVSSTLEEPLEWNNSTLIKGDVAEEVARLKRQPGKDILVFGSADLVNALMEHDLIDEYRLMVFPVVVGSGKRLFGEGTDTKVLDFVKTETFGSGVVVLTYRPSYIENAMKKHVLFVHGGGEGAYEADKKLAASLRDALGAAYDVQSPKMPDEDDPKVGAWKEKIAGELAAMDGGAILVGHSVGAHIVLRYLSEEEVEKPVAGLFLVATPYVGTGGWEFEEGALLEDFASGLPEGLQVFLYHSRDDEVVPFEHLALHEAKLPRATIREFDGRGHQFGDDLSGVARDIEGLSTVGDPEEEENE